MKIAIDKELVELSPDNELEAKDLEALWRLVLDCAGFNKKLVPVGEYVPLKSTCARFVIEDIALNAAKAPPEARAEHDCTCYCQQCNKYCNLKKNDRIPMCCGKLMEILD